MEAKNILDKIEESVKKNKIHVVQKGDLTQLIDGYNDILTDFKTLDAEKKEELFKEIRATRPLIGRRLLEQLEEDSK